MRDIPASWGFLAEARVRDRGVAFSCKGRGFRPSCDTAAHLVDWDLPEAPIRQWVLSLPFGSSGDGYTDVIAGASGC